VIEFGGRESNRGTLFRVHKIPSRAGQYHKKKKKKRAREGGRESVWEKEEAGIIEESHESFDKICKGRGGM